MPPLGVHLGAFAPSPPRSPWAEPGICWEAAGSPFSRRPRGKLRSRRHPGRIAAPAAERSGTPARVRPREAGRDRPRRWARCIPAGIRSGGACFLPSFSPGRLGRRGGRGLCDFRRLRPRGAPPGQPGYSAAAAAAAAGRAR